VNLNNSLADELNQPTSFIINVIIIIITIIIIIITIIIKIISVA